MEFEQLIEQRRSVRSYKDEPIERELIETILKEAQSAPSWKNSQAARVYAVIEKEKLEKVRSTLPSFNQKSSAGACLLVTTFVRKVSGHTQSVPDNEGGDLWGAYDLGLHDAYLILSAKNHGLDTLIMGLRDSEQLRDILAISEDEEIMSVIALGHGEGQPAFKNRKALEEVAVID